MLEAGADVAVRGRAVDSRLDRWMGCQERSARGFHRQQQALTARVAYSRVSGLVGIGAGAVLRGFVATLGVHWQNLELELVNGVAGVGCVASFARCPGVAGLAITTVATIAADSFTSFFAVLDFSIPQWRARC